MIDVEAEIRKACEEVGIDWEKVEEFDKMQIVKCFKAEISREVSYTNKLSEAYYDLILDVARKYLRMWLHELKKRV